MTPGLPTFSIFSTTLPPWGAARLCALCLLSLSSVAEAAVEGRVTASAGVPVEGARVELHALDGTPLAHTATDARGVFAFPDAEPPVQIVVAHPRFREIEVSVTADRVAAGERALEVELTPKQEVYEEIVVSADRAGDAFSPATLTSTAVTPEESVGPPSTLLEVVEGVPGVAENGQGGVFQVLSIRGISRHRILTLVSGMQITSERRAGVSASFVDPLLMGTVDLLRGPASSYYGSGALGGVVQVFPEEFERLSVQAGYDSSGDETWQAVGWGRDGWSLGVARRRAGNAEAPDGTEINSHFEQVSATVRRTWRAGDERTVELLLIPTRGRDLGKANTDFPSRTTHYPEENHLLVKATVEDEDWRFYAWAHPHDLETDTRRVDVEGATLSRDTVFNETFDFGANFQRQLTLAPRLAARLGVDYFGRRGVDALEVERVPGEETVRRSTLSGGEQDEAAAYGSIRRRFGRASVETGGRWTWQRQENLGTASFGNTAWSGFAGAVVPLGSGFELAANVGTGLRFPNLSERFFTGTTGRGEILANRNLEPERSLNTDLRLRWFGERVFVETDAFVNRIDDYIERIEIEEDVLTFVNLTSGRLKGLEMEGFYEVDRRHRLLWGGHLIEGEDSDGNPLADVPANRLFVGFRRGVESSGPGAGRSLSPRRWSWETRVERRDDVDDPGSGEKRIPAVTLVSARIGIEVCPGLEIILSAANLLDEEYFNSADDKVPLAPGRSVGVAFEWRP
jgi:outer membrane receptor protein involved in Fe transport